MTMVRKFATVLTSLAAIAALSACVPSTDNTYRGTVGSSEASAPASAIATPSVPAVPVDLSGNGEQVVTADLVATGYTVSYRASSWTIIVEPVQADGSTGVAVVNGIGQDTDSGVTGTTTYRATGRTTFHVYNTQGPWTLTFTPLA